MPEMKTWNANGQTYEIVDAKARTTLNTIAPSGRIPIEKGGTNATTESKARQNLHVPFSTPLYGTTNFAGFKIVGNPNLASRRIPVTVVMCHQNGWNCRITFVMDSKTGAPMVNNTFTRQGDLGVTSFLYSTEDNTTTYYIKFNKNTMYGMGSISFVNFIATNSGHQDEQNMALDAYQYLHELTEGTAMTETLDANCPEMVLGTEYRTTERWQGKAVYTRLIACGTMPSAGAIVWKAFGANTGITNIIRVLGVASNTYTVPYNGEAGEVSIGGLVNTDNAWIFMKGISGDFTAHTCTAQVWYVKK